MSIIGTQIIVIKNLLAQNFFIAHFHVNRSLFRL